MRVLRPVEKRAGNGRRGDGEVIPPGGTNNRQGKVVGQFGFKEPGRKVEDADQRGGSSEDANPGWITGESTNDPPLCKHGEARVKERVRVVLEE